MLRIFDERPVSRRELLTIGGLSLGGLTLPIGTSHGAAPVPHLTGKSVIYLFQQGGPSQFETFDPKLEAPDGIRTLTDTVADLLAGSPLWEPHAAAVKASP